MKITKLVLTLGIILVAGAVTQAQKWGGAYGNEWLEGKFNQPWVKITVDSNAVYRVPTSSLPLEFQTADKALLQLFHRGKQVSIIKADPQEVVFYGVKNDGKSDELLYRNVSGVPDPAARDNPYFSLFSSKSAYFLTVGAENGLRAVTQNTPLNMDLRAETYHLADEIRTFQNNYSHSLNSNYVTPTFVQSFLESGKGLTSVIYGKYSGTGGTLPRGDATIDLRMRNYAKDVNVAPSVELLLYARTYASFGVDVKVGKDAATLRNVDGAMPMSLYRNSKKNFSLNPSTDLTSEGTFRMALASNTVTNNFNTTGLFSMTFIKLTYPQRLLMQGEKRKSFTFPVNGAADRRIRVEGATDVSAFNISDVDAPIVLPIYDNEGVQVMSSSQPSAPLTVYVSSENVTINPDQLAPVTFTSLDHNKSDYLIISTSTLWDGALAFENYRKSKAGGEYNSMLIDIKQVYDQFNYGEPSPVAIKHFADYMAQTGIRKGHNLLLIGSSVTDGDQTRNVARYRDLPGQVPTVGFPGSDVLLVSGLSGNSIDVPSIPIGRIPATTNDQVMNYLDKVKVYDAYEPPLSWKHNVMHVSGGLNVDEVNRFARHFTESLDAEVKAAPFKGVVITKKKDITKATTNPLTLAVKQEIDSGVGMISYFGHGNAHYTDNNMGYVSDARRNYNNAGKFPLMYFNGCGVGNVFSGKVNPYPANYTGSDKNLGALNTMPMSMDWLLAKDKGSIAAIGNSYYAFESTSKTYLVQLYKQIFDVSDKQRPTLGLIHKAAANAVINPSNGRMAASPPDVANTHQSLILGDPAIHILTLEDPLPVGLLDLTAQVVEGNAIQLDWKTSWEVNNDRFEIERSADAKTFTKIGTIAGNQSTDSEKRYTFKDIAPLPGINYYRLRQVDHSSTDAQDGASEYSRIVFASWNGKEEAYTVYPNPAANTFSIKTGGRVTWILRNTHGKEISKGTRTANNSLANLPAGTYFVEIRTSQGLKLVRKLVKD